MHQGFLVIIPYKESRHLFLRELIFMNVTAVGGKATEDAQAPHKGASRRSLDSGPNETFFRGITANIIKQYPWYLHIPTQLFNIDMNKEK